MRFLGLFTATLASLGIICCNPANTLTPITSIEGSWEAIEYHFSIGTPDLTVQQLDPGTIISFYADNTFSFNILPDCDKETYTDINNKITLNYTCDTSQISIQYQYRIFERELSLWNKCTEECFVKYKYIEE